MKNAGKDSRKSHIYSINMSPFIFAQVPNFYGKSMIKCYPLVAWHQCSLAARIPIDFLGGKVPICLPVKSCFFWPVKSHFFLQEKTWGKTWNTTIFPGQNSSVPFFPRAFCGSTCTATAPDRAKTLVSVGMHHYPDGEVKCRKLGIEWDVIQWLMIYKWIYILVVYMFQWLMIWNLCMIFIKMEDSMRIWWYKLHL